MPTTETRRPDAVSEQPVLFCGIDENSSMSVKIVENAGAVLHSWTLDVFDHRDNSEHLPEDYRPLSRPGGRIAGLLSLDSGDFVLNFEPSGPMRIDVCERLIWRRQLVTRHSATLADNGNFHLSGTSTTRAGHQPGRRPCRASSMRRSSKSPPTEISSMSCQWLIR